MAWRARRNIEKSLLKYVRDSINANWTGINVGHSFNYNEKNMPFVACRTDSATHPRLELGSNLLDSQPLVIIDIYATGEGQKLGLLQYLVEKLIEGFQYYEYTPNPSNPDNPTKVAKGWVYAFNLSDTNVDFGENVGKCDKFRSRITLNLRRNKK